MSNIWVHQSGQYPQYDQPYDRFDSSEVFYKGKRAKEIWYKGRKIWDGTMTFWKWASRYGADTPYRNNDYFRQVYIPSVTTVSFSRGGNRATVRRNNIDYYYKKEYIKYDFYAIDVSVGELVNWHNDYKEYTDIQKLDPDSQEEPDNEILTLPGSFEITIDKKNESLYRIDVINSENVPTKDIYTDRRGAWNVYYYQTVFPCASILAKFSVPYGKYELSGFNDVTAYARGGHQFIYSVSTSLSVTHVGDVSLASWGGNIVDGKDETITVNSDALFNDIASQTEIGGRYGEAGYYSINYFTPTLKRTVPYVAIERPGKIIGKLNTKEDGRGQEFWFVVNEKEKNGVVIDPTIVLDPETLEYVEADYYGYYDPVASDYNLYANWKERRKDYEQFYLYSTQCGWSYYFAKEEIKYTVIFSRDYVEIRKKHTTSKDEIKTRLYYM